MSKNTDTALNRKPAITACEYCHNERLCNMYVLQTGETAWVCAPCRTGKKEATYT